MKFDPSWIGRTLAGRFTITGAIGAGGMAQVVRGFDPGTLREVAIKILDPVVGRNRTVLKRFQREAKLVAEFSHRNVVEVFDAGVDGDDLHFIIMELLVGRDLFETMTAVNRLDEARAARIVAQICDALAAAHARGIVHRDLKPENVMLVDDPDAPGEEMVKVLDFGVAKILDVGADAGPARSSMRTAITGVGTILGTPGYMSPEQGRLEPVDSRTDIYACGVMLYQLVTGRLPFDGETPLQILAKHVQEEPPPPRTWLSDIHPGLEAAIARAMAKKPSDRHQTATELGDALRAVLPELSTSQRDSLPTPPRARSSRRPLPLVRVGSPLSAAATLAGSVPPPPPARAESVDDAATTLIRKDRRRKTSSRDR